MSEETTETTDKESNFAALRAEKEALESRLAELQPLAVEKAVRSAGFDPDTPEGKALTRLSTVESDAESVKSLAAELGFEAVKPRPELSAQEQAAATMADRQAQISSVTSPDSPPNFDQMLAGLNGQISQAQAAGDHAQVRRLNQQVISLNNQLLAQQMAAKARG